MLHTTKTLQIPMGARTSFTTDKVLGDTLESSECKGPERESDTVLFRARLRQMVDELPDAERKIVCLRYPSISLVRGKGCRHCLLSARRGFIPHSFQLVGRNGSHRADNTMVSCTLCRSRKSRKVSTKNTKWTLDGRECVIHAWE